MKLELRDPGLYTKTVDVADEAEADEFLNAAPQNRLWTMVFMRAENGTIVWTREVGDRKWHKFTLALPRSIQNEDGCPICGRPTESSES